MILDDFDNLHIVLVDSRTFTHLPDRFLPERTLAPIPFSRNTNPSAITMPELTLTRKYNFSSNYLPELLFCGTDIILDLAQFPKTSTPQTVYRTHFLAIVSQPPQAILCFTGGSKLHK